MQKKGLTAFLFWLPGLLGICGIQRFYLNRPLSGLLWLFTFGLFGLGQLYDLLFMGSLVRETNMLNATSQTRTGIAGRIDPSFSVIRLNVSRAGSPAQDSSKVD